MPPGTAHREWRLYVIERPLSRDKLLSCDLSQLLTLRRVARSADGGQLS
jgi:hypothetical protein